jgi:hypothetical protein
MSYMFELYYAAPADARKEAKLTEAVAKLGGRLDYREEPTGGPSQAICLTYEFADWDLAEQAADSLRKQGEYIEGPFDYA